MKDLDFLPECFVDTNLTETSLDVKVNHQLSCTKVTGVMEKKKIDSFAVGIIDDDKRKTKYVDEFSLIASKGHIKLLKHPERHHYLIIISPAIDRFILDCAKDSNINISTFNLPNKLKDFTDESKKVTSNKDDRFKQLFKVLFNINNEFKTFKILLNYLKTCRYDSAKSELLKLFQ